MLAVPVKVQKAVCPLPEPGHVRVQFQCRLCVSYRRDTVGMYEAIPLYATIETASHLDAKLNSVGLVQAVDRHSLVCTLDIMFVLNVRCRMVLKLSDTLVNAYLSSVMRHLTSV